MPFYVSFVKWLEACASDRTQKRTGEWQYCGKGAPRFAERVGPHRTGGLIVVFLLEKGTKG